MSYLICEPRHPQNSHKTSIKLDVLIFDFCDKEASIWTRKSFISMSSRICEPRYPQNSHRNCLALNQHKISITLDYRFLVSVAKRHRYGLENRLFQWTMSSVSRDIHCIQIKISWHKISINKHKMRFFIFFVSVTKRHRYGLEIRLFQ